MNFNPAPKKYPTWADIPDLNDPMNWYRKKTIGPWKKWFAWYPVKYKNKWIWLSHIYRIKVVYTIKGDEKYEYGTIFDVLNND